MPSTTAFHPMDQDSGYATGVFRPEPPAVVIPAGQRWARRLLQASGVAVIVAAATYKAFELDRFFVPKELTLHLAALLVGLLCLFSARRVSWSRVDALLAGFIALAAVSAAFAQNPWAAQRAVGVSASGVVLFWGARSLARAGLGRSVLAGLALAVVLGAATSLAQTYGVRLDVFSLNRAPGGTLGNRNFVAHLCAFGLPVLLLVALRAWRTSGFVLGAMGVGATAATLVLTRSRAGWLGAAAALAVFVVGALLSRPVRRQGRTWLRLATVLLFAAGGVAVGILVPNKLRWRSDNPYAETAADLVNYQEGSGKGRLIQYENSLRMAISHPLLGVGPGNWSVAYPRFATRRDPSLDPTAPGMTSNPWPSSDWAAILSERGFAATVLLLIVFAGLGLAALGRARGARDADEGLVAVALGSSVAAALVVGAFDAVLLLALPALIIWSALGALSGELPEGPSRPLAPALRPLLALLLLLVAGGSALRSGAQLVAMGLYDEGSRAALAKAARLDPGSFRIRVRLARAYSGRRDCEKRREQVEAAHALYPEADLPVSARRCRR